jgi:hypothetical protein
MQRAQDTEVYGHVYPRIIEPSTCQAHHLSFTSQESRLELAYLRAQLLASVGTCSLDGCFVQATLVAARHMKERIEVNLCRSTRHTIRVRQQGLIPESSGHDLN